LVRQADKEGRMTHIWRIGQNIGIAVGYQPSVRHLITEVNVAKKAPVLVGLLDVLNEPHVLSLQQRSRGGGGLVAIALNRRVGFDSLWSVYAK
jgi:hypothetical protein